MSKRVSPTERIRAEIDALFVSERDLASTLEDVARLKVRLMMQTAIEAEVDEFFGRARYERRDDENRPGSRNGHQPPTAVKTTMRPVELQRPKLRGTDEDRSPRSIEPRRRPHSHSRPRCRQRRDGAIPGAFSRTTIVERSAPT